MSNVVVELKLSLSVLNELVHATSNAQVALQLLEGTYKSPIFPQIVYNTSRKENVTLKEFDKWTNKITYSYPKYRWYNAEGTDWNGSKTEKYSDGRLCGTSTDYCSAEDWWSYHQAFKDNADAEWKDTPCLTELKEQMSLSAAAKDESASIH